MIGEIIYQYTPISWNQEEFLRLGGFSIVVLNYNKKGYIKEAIESAFEQDFPLLEIFLMDDASTDGSWDEMELTAKVYQGRHKVTVIRNTENQRITGQWNIVSQLATGNWLGMFCGDDWSYPDRVSNVAKRIKSIPTLKGICASGIEVGKREMKVGWSSEVITEDGASSLAQMADGVYPIIGASVFWHKSLFVENLPYAPLDDLLLRWNLQLLYKNETSPIWMWDGETNAIKYSYGSGITTAAYVDNTGLQTATKRWIANTKSMKHFARLATQTYIVIERWARIRKCEDKAYFGYLRHNRLQCEIKAGNTWSRLIKLPAVLLEMMTLAPDWRHAIAQVKFWCKYFIQEFFGLHVAAYLSVFKMQLKRKVAK